MAPFDDATDPVAEVKALSAELKKYDADLAKKPRWLVLNKADLVDEGGRDKRAAAIVKKLRWTKPWFVIAGINGEGTKELTYKVMEFLEEQKGARREARGASGA
jgi:GTP-binding protein